ncbi:MAG TPA: 30S ribosomal protein S6 [Solirubrobacteraceae bacterium]|jgi:small subunit ribosomal protein S6
MTLPAPTYDLVLMLDLQAAEPTRAKVVAGARTAIESQGQLLRYDEWGERTLAYPIDHKTSAEYHLLQFHATPELLSTLNRTLRITDEVIRFRIIKLAPGTPEAPEMPAPAGAGPRAQAAPAAEAEAAPVPEAEVAPAADAEAEAAEPTAETVAAEPTAEALATPAALSEPA